MPRIVTTELLCGFAVRYGFIIAALMFWCGIERKPALKIAGSYFGLCVVLAIATSFLSRQVCAKA